MNDRSTRRYDVFGRVTTFGNQNTADFAVGSDAKKHFANLAQISQQLDQKKAGQQPGSATPKSVRLDALRLDVQTIARMARAMDQDEPGFADKFRLPKSASDGDLLTAADAMTAQLVIDPGDDAATQAAKTALVARFVAKEFDPNFAQNLADDRTAIDDAGETLEGGREKSVGSTAAIDQLIGDGMKEVNYLDAIMHVKYARNAEKMRAWLSASHIERAPQREKKPAPTPPSAAPGK
jgi:hypothetical protein